MRPPLSASVPLLVTLAGLVLVAAFLAAAETALLRVPRVRLEVAAEKGDRGAARLLRLVRDLPRVLNAVLLTVLLVQVGAATLAAVVAERHFGNTGVTIASVLLTVVMFVYTEAIPKTVAVRHPLLTARLVALPVATLALITRPVVTVLLFLADLQSPGKGIPSATSVTEAELRRLAAEAADAGEIARADLDLIERSFVIGDTPVREIAVPRPSVVAIPLDTPIDEALDRALRSGHRRLPVYRDDLDGISGVVRLHELAAAVSTGRPGTLAEIQQPVLTVAESRPVRAVLRDMQAAGRHLAVVVDEHGGTSGIVTVEDAVAQLVGHIDETGRRRPPAVRFLGPGRWEVDGSAPIPELEKALGVPLPEGRWRTAAGLVIGAAGHLPQAEERVEVAGLVFRVTAATRRRVVRLEVTALPAGSDGNR
ncbi:MAG: HlyC/CorC family transporter [Acidimicrobiia bacterium]|nr:HlyC/CorC family transporter [Acidimicrobiia bacterium]